MANKVYTLLDFGAAEGKPKEEKTVNNETYSDISMVGEPYASKPRRKARIMKNVDVQAVKGALHNLFKFLPGERILNPDFGNKLYGLLYNPNVEYSRERITAEIQNMVSKYEPRAVIDVIIDNTKVKDIEDSSVQLIIEWHVAGFETTKYRIELP